MPTSGERARRDGIPNGHHHLNVIRSSLMCISVMVSRFYKDTQGSGHTDHGRLWGAIFAGAMEDIGGGS